MLQGFFTPFFTILLAEMLDKSQLAVIALSSGSKKYLSIFLGSILAFILVDGAAILFGATVSEFIPKNIVSLTSALIFIGFGILSFRKEKDGEEKKPRFKNMFLGSFTAIFFSEWADKTQLASAAFATYLNPFAVFLGVISALSIVTLLAIFVGTKLNSYIKKERLHKVTGGIFLVLGAYFLYSAL